MIISHVKTVAAERETHAHMVFPIPSHLKCGLIMRDAYTSGGRKKKTDGLLHIFPKSLTTWTATFMSMSFSQYLCSCISTNTSSKVPTTPYFGCDAMIRTISTKL